MSASLVGSEMCIRDRLGVDGRTTADARCAWLDRNESWSEKSPPGLGVGGSPRPSRFGTWRRRRNTSRP
eukprot:14230072-Alexandrium_andersonii.AAC.1